MLLLIALGMAGSTARERVKSMDDVAWMNVRKKNPSEPHSALTMTTNHSRADTSNGHLSTTDTYHVSLPAGG